jgi:hypothetical protein
LAPKCEGLKILLENCKNEIEKSKDFINKFTVKGFRAPKMSITSQNIEVLKLAGFTYDSSIYGSFPFINKQGISTGLLVTL